MLPLLWKLFPDHPNLLPAFWPPADLRLLEKEKLADLGSTDELFDNEHLNAVGFFEEIDTPQGKMRFPGVPTWFSETPGKVAGPCPTLGENTDEVLREWLGADDAQLRAWFPAQEAA